MTRESALWLTDTELAWLGWLVGARPEISVSEISPTDSELPPSLTIYQKARAALNDLHALDQGKEKT